MSHNKNNRFIQDDDKRMEEIRNDAKYQAALSFKESLCKDATASSNPTPRTDDIPRIPGANYFDPDDHIEKEEPKAATEPTKQPSHTPGINFFEIGKPRSNSEHNESSEKMELIGLRVSNSYSKKLKIHCANNNVSMQQFLTEITENYFNNTYTCPHCGNQITFQSKPNDDSNVLPEDCLCPVCKNGNLKKQTD